MMDQVSVPSELQTDREEAMRVSMQTAWREDEREDA
jgi:hypothetical protein